MKRNVVMLVRYEDTAYVAQFPDYPKIGMVYANDASTLLTKGKMVLEETLKLMTLGKPQTLSAFVFSQPENVIGSFLAVIEVDFPNGTI